MAYGIRYYLGFGLYRVQVLLHRSSVFQVELSGLLVLVVVVFRDVCVHTGG